MTRRTESEALAQLQRLKASYQSDIRRNYGHAARDCATCPTRGSCCTDAHFVNVHITRLEAVAIRETIERTPRLSLDEKRAVYSRAREAVTRYSLRAAGDTFAQTFACPLYVPRVGCLVHRRAKPAPCIQHACYDRWEDLPPHALEERAEHRVEKLNTEVYGAEWAWLPIPLWLTLVDPESDGSELLLLTRAWRARSVNSEVNKFFSRRGKNFRARARVRMSLPVIN